jgi:hypothetical protein
MIFDPTRPSSDRNRARPLTAAEAFVQSEAKSRIMMSRKARRVGFGLAVTGLIGFVIPRRLRDADVQVTFPDGRVMGFTIMQVVSLCLIPVGLLMGITAFILHRRYMRAAIADPITAAIFDPSVEWPEEV